MGLRADGVVLGQQHSEQDELCSFHVEHAGIERAFAQLLGDAEELRVDVAGKFEPRRRQRRQRTEHLDIAVAEFHEIGGKLLLRVAHHSTLILASWMIFRHFGSSDLMKAINSSGDPAIDWNK